MTLPREVVPDQFHVISRRCMLRKFLLRPDDDTNNAYIYCLGESAQRFGIDVLLPTAMSNHDHVVIYDRRGRYPEFMHRFHLLLARCMNSLRGRWENFWSSSPPSVVRLVEREDVMRMLVYVATNPVKAQLVDKVHHWPGVKGYAALIHGRPLVATRPRHFFRDGGNMPETVTLHLTIPPELGDRHEVIRELEERVAAVEAQHADERLRTGKKVLGRKAVMEQHWNMCPSTYEPRRKLSPKVAAGNKWPRIETLLRNRQFVDDYRAARRDWLAGSPAAFPIGTYWLRRFANVPIAKPRGVDTPSALAG